MKMPEPVDPVYELLLSASATLGAKDPAPAAVVAVTKHLYQPSPTLWIAALAPVPVTVPTTPVFRLKNALNVLVPSKNNTLTQSRSAFFANNDAVYVPTPYVMF
jgi:hypothetical protein